MRTLHKFSSLTDNFVAGILDRHLELVRVSFGGIERDANLAVLQCDIHAGNAGNGLEHVFDATYATHAGHAFDGESDGFQFVYSFFDFQRFNSSELLTTDTELIAMAAPAITGFSMPNAASGIPSTL